MANTEVHTCDCGFTWQHGQNGQHQCEPHYRKIISELRVALVGDDPEHSEPFMYKMPGDYDWHVGFAPLPEGAFRIKALAAAPLPQQAAGDGLIDKPVAQVIRDADGCDDIQWLVDSASGDVQPGDLLYKK